jgi:phosphoglycerol transferase MdoB-like AlkP superfamily enzyme
VAAHNIVILIVESFGREYIGALNETLEGGKYQGYTPFVDELCDSCVTFRWSFCNGRKSIDGMPSILSAIPMFVEPFFLTPASMNEVGGLAQALREKGYETAFFHGAENGSMGFQAFARKTGFQKYFGRTEYNADPRFNGDKDFDGMWAIWDEPFLQFYAQQMSELREPFMTAVFTASSHHPYAIPEQYKDTYPEEGIIIKQSFRGGKRLQDQIEDLKAMGVKKVKVLCFIAHDSGRMQGYGHENDVEIDALVKIDEIRYLE